MLTLPAIDKAQTNQIDSNANDQSLNEEEEMGRMYDSEALRYLSHDEKVQYIHFAQAAAAHEPQPSDSLAIKQRKQLFWN